MAGGYVVPAEGDLGFLVQRLEGMATQIKELERPTGTQLAQAVAQLTALVDDLQTQVDNLLATEVNTGNVNATGTISAGGTISAVGTISAGGTISADGTISAGGTISTNGDVTASNGRVTGNTGLRSTGVYNNLLTSSFRVVYVSSVNGPGDLGYVPSSRQFKQDIADAELPPEVWRALRLVTFRYIAAVAELGDQAEVEWGLIAEEVHDLGLTWLVDYDEFGKPFGIKKESIALALIPAIQNIDDRLMAAGI